MEHLANIKNLTDSSSSQSTLTKEASSTIDRYMKTVRSTTSLQGFFELQGDLVSALGKVTFTIDCLEKKIRGYSVVASRCEAGIGSIQDIFDDVLDEFDLNGQACNLNVSMLINFEFNYLLPVQKKVLWMSFASFRDASRKKSAFRPRVRNAS